MTETQETIFAQRILASAHQMAWITARPEDVDAATAAILCHALTLATPTLSPEGRARLFMEEE